MFKRILAGIIACMMIVCALPLGVSAAEDGTTTLRFTAAGGEGSMDDIVVTRETAGSTKFPENGFTREGYEFKGWGTSATYAAWQPGTSVSRMSSSYLKYSGNVVTIMPVWAGAKISVTFDDCNGNSETRSLVVGKTYDYVYDATKTDNARRDYGFGYPTRDGYKFLGWFKESGEEIGYSYKFTADDDGITLSAHWSRAKTITLDFNGGTTGYGKYKKTSDTYELLENGTITASPDLAGKIVKSWNTKQDGTGKNYGDADLSFDEITTLYAQYRDIERTLKFFKEHGTIDSTNVVLKSGGEESIMYTLPGDTYMKDGYDLVSWECSEANSYGRAKTVKVGDSYEIRFTASKEKDSYIFYANWEINTLGRALEAISKVLPKNNEVKSTGALGLPTEGDGYSITYKSSDTNYIDNDGNVILLPADGTKNVTITAAIKTGDETFDRDFVLTLFSADSTDIKEKLTAALENILDQNTVHVNYSENANFCDFMSAKFAENGIDGVKVTITNEPKKFGDRAGIAKDGTIRFYFYDGLTSYEDNNTRVPYVDIKIEKSGVVIEKEITAELDWDFAKVDAALDKAFDNVTIASRVAEGDSIAALPKTGLDATSVSGITWTSDNPAITIGALTDGKFPVSVTHSEKSVDVTITGTIVWTNPHDDQSQTTRTAAKTYNVRVVGTDPTLSEPADYSAVDAAIAKAPTDSEKYTAESFAALTSAINAVERGLTKDDQAKVDAFAKAILDAIDNIVVAPTEDEDKDDDNFFFIILAELIRRKTLTVVSDGETVSAETYENGTVIDLSELDAPEKDGYLFTGWYADAELTKKLDTVTLDRDTTIYAGFENIIGELDAEAAADRAAVVSILWKIAGKPVVNYILPFADVDEESDIAEAVRWAASEQIVNGFEDETFRAEEKITREQLAVMLFRVARAENVETSADFTDIAEVSDWAVDAVNWAVSEGVISGFEDRTLRPAGEVTVAEVIAAAVRF